MKFLSIIVSYLLGSIPSAYIIGSVKNIDVTKAGSCNVGTANIFDLIGFKAALLTLLLDIGKGYLTAYLGYYFFATITGSFFCGMAALIGHSWSIFIKGRGGKGLATTAGLIIFIGPILLIPLLIVIILINVFTSSVTLSTIGSALIFPLLTYYLYDKAGLIFGFLVVALIIINLRKDIKAVFEGQEKKFNIIARLIEGGGK